MNVMAPCTICNGKSHLTTSVAPGINLFTKDGHLFYKRKIRSIEAAKKNNSLDFYKKWLSEELAETDNELTDFLDGYDSNILHNMSDKDVDGWQIYHTLLDEHTILKHFIRILK